MKILIQNGRVIDPSVRRDEQLDVLIENGVIKAIAPNIEDESATIIDGSGKFVMPGFVDLHVHLREPGFTEKEDIESGCRAAVKGGVTTLVAMPNTKPSADNRDIIQFVHKKAEQIGLCKVVQSGAITVGQGGETLADLEGMHQEGALAFSEDGKSVMNTELYRQGMEICSKMKAPVFAHCEDKFLVAGGVMNKGERAKELKLKGIGNYVEDVIVARDILLSKATNCQLHLCHCSTKDSVEMIRQAKQANLKVSGEVCPHHFILTDNDILRDDANYKMNPPLRSKDDVQALINGLKDGTMEVISTDHAPHTKEEKDQSMAKAPFGIIGLETMAILTYTELVKKGYLSPLQMAEKMSFNPAKILHIDRGSIDVGKVADVVVFDPRETYLLTESDFSGKGRNTPFLGKEVSGRVTCTIFAGKIVYQLT